MRRLFFAAVLSTIAVSGAAAQEDWAAQVPYDGGGGPVAFGPTKEIAGRRAVAACRRHHEGCATSPANVRVSDFSLFVTTCCRDGSDTRCRVQATEEGGDTGRRQAFRASLGDFRAEGIATDECWRAGVYSVQTGEQLDD